MPFPRFDNLDAQQKARILAAAQAEFARRGYDDASLARIAAEAGISKGTLYYYFSDRDDLYATIVARVVAEVAGQSVLGGFAPQRAADFWPALETLFRNGFDLARKHPEEMRALRSFQVSVRRHPRPAFEPVLQMIAAHVRVLVETGRRLGCIRSDVSVEFLVALYQGVDEVLDRAFYDSSPGSDARAFERQAVLAIDLFRRLMSPPSAAARTTTATKKHTVKKRERNAP